MNGVTTGMKKCLGFLVCNRSSNSDGLPKKFSPVSVKSTDLPRSSVPHKPTFESDLRNSSDGTHINLCHVQARPQLYAVTLWSNGEYLAGRGSQASEISSEDSRY